MGFNTHKQANEINKRHKNIPTGILGFFVIIFSEFIQSSYNIIVFRCNFYNI